nr:hypothetical protein [Tanacetum cinerariifolium]
GLHKGYDMFQTLLSQLEIHGASVSHEDANQKFLRVFERDVKGTTASSSSNSQNMAFVFGDNTSSTNDVVMISIRIKKFHKRTGRKFQFDTRDTVGFDKTKVECFNCHKIGHFTKDYKAKWNQDSRRRDGGYNGNKARDNNQRLTSQDDSKALVTIDGEVVDWSGHVKKDTQNFAMMAYSSSNSGFDNEVQTCSIACAHSYARLKKLYDEKRDKLGDASVEITDYTLALKKVEAQLLSEALKEKVDLNTKVENWQNSSKNLNRLLNTQMNVNDKFRLGYGNYRYGSILSYENEVLQGVFMNKECDLENKPVNDRYAKGMHTVPPFMIGNYMPSVPDVEIDYSKFTYGPKQTLADESDSKPVKDASSDSGSSVEPSTSVPELVINELKVVSEPKAVSPKEANHSAGTTSNDHQDANSEEIDLHDEHFVLHVWFAYLTTIQSSQDKIQKTTDCKTSEKPDVNTNNTNLLNAVSAPVSAVGPSRALNDDEPTYPDDPSMPHLEDI